MYYGFFYVNGSHIGPMMRWTFNRSSEENTIVASGTNNLPGYQSTYALIGKTEALERGRVRMDLKMSYTDVRSEISMRGCFDLEENSFKGTGVMPNGVLGELAFKRDPDFARLYPAPSTIDAKARWRFATAVILDRVRRRPWSPSYISK